MQLIHLASTESGFICLNSAATKLSWPALAELANMLNAFSLQIPSIDKIHIINCKQNDNKDRDRWRYWRNWRVDYQWPPRIRNTICPHLHSSRLFDCANRQQEITALVRPSSVEKPATISLKERGIKIVPIDIGRSHDELVATLTGIDTVISAIHFQSLDDEIPLSNAAKRAGVKRYVPCFFATIAPRGIMDARDRVR
jgi:hypothetical protein